MIAASAPVAMAPFRARKQQALVAACGIADAVHAPHDGVQCRVIADGVVGACQVVVDSARQSHDGKIKFAGKQAGTA